MSTINLVPSFRSLSHSLLGATLLLFTLNLSLIHAQPLARVKDIARLQGARKNQLIGTGLVIGLQGTGDKTDLTRDMILNTMKNLGMKVNQQSMDAKNAAAVIITADLPPFTSPGDQINVTVSTMGDAGSLKGGVLIQTPLRGADGRIYAVAQGALSVGGSTAGNHLNVAKIPRGATVEREVPMNFVNNHTIYYLLRNKDFTTANRMADAINETFGPGAARAQDAGKIEVHIPYSFQDNPVEFISQIDHISILVDQEARVVINERTGTVVFGGTVKISPVAISHKSMAIKVGNELNPINEESHVVNLDKGSTVEELIKTLNLMGVKTEDLIAIIQEIRNAGALQANLEIM